MLYIEDFLELIEPFPTELRERLTEMREIDLQIQNETDKLDDRIQVFFHQCKRQRNDWKNENYEEIRREYLKLLESAEDKVQIANQLYDLIEKYLKKLDQELQKFKLELEADHAGITSKLEQVISSSNNANMNDTSPVANPNMCSGGLSLDDSDFTLTSSSTNELMMMMLAQQQQQQQQHQEHQTPSSHAHTTTSHKRKHSNLTARTVDDEDSSSSWSSKLELSQQKSNATFHFSNCNKKISSLIASTSQTTSSNKKGTGNVCFGQRPASTATTADNATIMKLARNNSVPSQAAAAATNRRSTSSKPIKPPKQRKKNKISDYDYDDDDYDLKNDLEDNDFTDELNEEASETATSENDNVFNGLSGHRNLNDDYFESDNSSSDEQANLYQNEDTTSDEILDNKMKKDGSLKRAGARPFKEDWNSSEDTNERYCICKDISYGDMIMCDNSRCGTQWFHFVCVGLNAAPKGKWFCPTCVESKKKRKEKLTINNLNPTSSSFISLNKQTTDSQQQQQQQQQHHPSNPFLSSSSSFSINFNDKNF